MISFKHILGTNMVSILLRGRNTDYEFAAAITHILNTGTVRMVSACSFSRAEEPRRFALVELTPEGWWKEFTKSYVRKAGPLAVYLGNGALMMPEVPTTYAELEKLGNFNRFLTPVMASRSPAEDDE